jgi:hypothetical protein
MRVANLCLGNVILSTQNTDHRWAEAPQRLNEDGNDGRNIAFANQIQEYPEKTIAEQRQHVPVDSTANFSNPNATLTEKSQMNVLDNEHTFHDSAIAEDSPEDHYQTDSTMMSTKASTTIQDVFGVTGLSHETNPQVSLLIWGVHLHSAQW